MGQFWVASGRAKKNIDNRKKIVDWSDWLAYPSPVAASDVTQTPKNMTANTNTTTKLRAIAALGLPEPRLIAGGAGDTCTYAAIEITPSMATWLARHPEAFRETNPEKPKAGLTYGQYAAQTIRRDRSLSIAEKRRLMRIYAPHGAF